MRLIADKNDVMTCAETGSGKTAAFLLPIINNMLKNGKNYSLSFLIMLMLFLGVKPLDINMENYWTIKPTVLIIAPTRELCTQIAREAAKFVFNTDIKIANIYGGSNIRVQRKHACQAHIVSCTVGRLKVNGLVKLVTKARTKLTNI